MSKEMMYGAGAVVLLVVVVMASKGGSSGAAPSTFDPKRGDYNLKLYQAGAQHDVQIRQVQADVDKAVISAGVAVTGIQADARAKSDTNITTRDLGMKQLDVMDADSSRKWAAQNYATDAAKQIGLAQVGVQQYQAETGRIVGTKQVDYAFSLGSTKLANDYSLGSQKIGYDYNLGQQKNANDAQKNVNDYNLGLAQNETDRQSGILNFFGGLFGGFLGLFGL